MALRDVNLIPDAILLRRYAMRHLALWVAALAVMLSAIWGGYGYACRSLRTRGARTERVVVTERELRDVIASILRVQGELEGLSFVNALLDRRAVTDVLWQLAELMNNETQLTSLQLGGPVAGSQMTLAGISKSNSTLGDFVSRLTQDPMFTRVDLKFSQEHDMAIPSGEGTPATAIRFEITCQIAEP